MPAVIIDTALQDGGKKTASKLIKVGKETTVRLTKLPYHILVSLLMILSSVHSY